MIKVLTAEKFFSLPPEECAPELEAKFFGSLKMRNGTFKTTQASRFAEIEVQLRPLVSKRAGQLRTALDVGASSGTTTIELADFLQAQGAEVELVATDLYTRAHLVQLLDDTRVLTDSSGYPLQYDIAGTAVRAWIRRLDYLTLAAIPLSVARSLVQRAAARKIQRGGVRTVELISRRLALRDNIELVEDDIMKRSPCFARRFDFVRAANILNLDYFPIEQLNTALRNIISYMRGPGALLLLTRTMEKPTQNAGSLFELASNGRLAEIERIGKGSEIKALVLELET